MGRFVVNLRMSPAELLRPHPRRARRHRRAVEPGQQEEMRHGRTDDQRLDPRRHQAVQLGPARPVQRPRHRQAQDIGKAVAVGLAGAATATAALGAKAVSMASDLEQSVGGVDSVFKETSSPDPRLRRRGRQRGRPVQELVQRAGHRDRHVAEEQRHPDEGAGRHHRRAHRPQRRRSPATFGGPVTGASNAMASALRGEFEPLRRYGVSLSQAEINSRALADTGKATAAELTKQEKALATQALIMEQSTDAAGAFARESNTLAGQSERLKANLEDLGASVGEALLPPLTALAEWVTTEGLPKLEEFGTWASENIGPALTELGETLQTALAAQAAGVRHLPHRHRRPRPHGRRQVDPGQLRLARPAGRGRPGRRRRLEGLAESPPPSWPPLRPVTQASSWPPTPSGSSSGLVAGLVAGLLYLWNTNEGFRDTVIRVWNAVKDTVGGVLTWFSELPGKFTTFMTNIGRAVSNGIDDVVDWFKRLPERASPGDLPWSPSCAPRAPGPLKTLGDQGPGRHHRGRRVRPRAARQGRLRPGQPQLHPLRRRPPAHRRLHRRDRRRLRPRQAGARPAHQPPALLEGPTAATARSWPTPAATGRRRLQHAAWKAGTAPSGQNPWRDCPVTWRHALRSAPP